MKLREVRESNNDLQINARHLVLRGLFIVFGSIVLTLFVPAIVAYRGRVFFSVDIQDKLPPTVLKAIQVFETNKAEMTSHIAEIDTLLQNKSIDAHGLQLLLNTRSELQERVSNMAPPYTVIGFYLNPQMLLWPSTYTCLAWLIFCFPPPIRSRIRLRGLLPLSFLIYVYYEWPLWIRNFVLGDRGRVIYAYPNYDIHPASFFTQEATILGFCVLLATVWLQWLTYFEFRHRNLKLPSRNFGATLIEHRLSEMLAGEFIRWTYSSVILALGFLFFTNFFWSLVARFHDQRYLLSALLAHTLWGLTWVLISLPVMDTWWFWNRCRFRALEELAGYKTPAGSVSEVQVRVIENLEPVSQLRLSFASIGTAVSFVLPLLQFFHT